LTKTKNSEIVISDRSHHGRDKNQKPKQKMNSKIAQSLTEKFAAQGFAGKELTLRVLAAGYFMAVAAGNETAAEHFAARHQEEEVK
jgi:hypothetical protein